MKKTKTWHIISSIYSPNCGSNFVNWLFLQIIGDHRPEFSTNREKPGFFLQTRDLSEKPGSFPHVTGKPGVCIRTREICRV